MRVALTMRITEAADYDEPRDSLSHDWLCRLDQWGMTPLLVPNRLRDPVTYLEELRPDIVVLTGGGDPGGTTARDPTERALLDHALERELAVLGVCRGLQAINVHLGGALSPLDGHVAVDHAVTVAPDWQDLYGARTTVNSFHDHGIAEDDVAPPLAPFAWDEAGWIEAAVHRDRPMAGVMWHPERRAPLAGDLALMRRIAGRGARPW